jgi:hypothetical protein
MKRKTYSHVSLLSELKIYPRDWHNYLRMNEETYLKLLSLVLPAIHYRRVNHNRSYNRNICRRYCSVSHGQWSCPCLRETSNQRRRIPKSVKEMENKSYWIQVGPCHTHHDKRNLYLSTYRKRTRKELWNPIILRSREDGSHNFFET